MTARKMRLAMVTRHVGLVTTASTTYNEPRNLGRKFATLDLISRGRAGWNAVASWSEHEAQSFGLETTLDYDTRQARSAEFVYLVKGLRDSWEDGALLFDKITGQYFDEAKMHVLDRHGRFFRVRGPLNVAGMPQGQIRELYLRSGITGSARIGTPSDIADAMQEWFEASAFDGFNVTPATLPCGGEDFVAMVVPELQRAAGSSVLNMNEGPPARTLA